MNELDISKIKKTKNKEQNTESDSLFEKVNSVLNKDISFGKKRFPDKKKLQLYNDLSMLLSSGIDIRNTFEIMEDNFAKKADKQLISSIYQNIVDGSTISDAFLASGKFTPYEYFSIQIGEETGRLNQVLQDLSDYFKKKIEQKRKIVGAFMYPIIVVVTAVLAIAFMLNFIVPMFEEIYKRFDKELPDLTKFIIKLSHQSTPMLLSLLFIVLSVFIFRLLAKKQTWYQQFKDGLLIRLPLFGDIIKKVQLSRFCLSMELLLSSRLPLINALGLIKNMIAFYPLNSALSKIEEGIMNGKTFNESMKTEKIFDKRMVSLVKVGEEVNQLDKTFSLLKEQYQAEVDHKSGLISSILEPLMIVFIGVFVALILVSMYLPIFKISTSFGV
jgi:type IV pilus assembly protein PilC